MISEDLCHGEKAIVPKNRLACDLRDTGKILPKSVQQRPRR